MAISLKSHETQGVSIIVANGRLTLGAETNDLREAVKQLLEAGRTRIVLDLDKLDYIDSSGLGTLVGLHTTAASKGAHIKLTRVHGHLQELLVITKLLTVFDIYDDEAAAVASFSASVKS